MMRKCKNHRQLKEQLYKEIIEMFDKGKVWEIALGICEELLNEYKCVTFDYNKISSILVSIIGLIYVHEISCLFTNSG